MKVIKIPYNRSIPATVHEVAGPESDNCLDEIKQLIGIDWAEIVVTTIKTEEDPRRDYILIVDGIGKMKEDWLEKINERACQFYAGAPIGNLIVGDVVLCAREWNETSGECDLDSLTDWEEEVIMFHLL